MSVLILDINLNVELVQLEVVTFFPPRTVETAVTSNTQVYKGTDHQRALRHIYDRLSEKC